MQSFFPQAGLGDNGLPFRTQETRSIEQIDMLLQRQEQLRHAIGLVRAAEIEAAPELVADGEKFQKWNASARNNAAFTTGAAVCAGSTLAAPKLGFSHGKQVIRAYSPIVAVGAIGSYAVFYQVYSRLAGWTSRAQNELIYARNIRMLRNIQVR